MGKESTLTSITQVPPSIFSSVCFYFVCSWLLVLLLAFSSSFLLSTSPSPTRSTSPTPTHQVLEHGCGVSGLHLLFQRLLFLFTHRIHGLWQVKRCGYTDEEHPRHRRHELSTEACPSVAFLEVVVLAVCVQEEGVGSLGLGGSCD